MSRKIEGGEVSGVQKKPAFWGLLEGKEGENKSVKNNRNTFSS